MRSLFLKHPLSATILALIFVSALAYLPQVASFGYLNDDWYLMYDGYVAGPDFLHTVFASDRPLRAFVVGPAFSLFGMSPVLYHVVAYLLRLSGGLAVLWLLKQLWPSNNRFNAATSFLFIVYPGFLSQINAIDYLSHQVSLAMALLSIASTVASIKSNSAALKWGFGIVSVLSGWISYGLMEYFVGFEALRFGCLALLVAPDKNSSWPVLNWISKTVRKIIPFWLSPVGFLAWRLFLFSPERRATDIGAQLGAFFASPFNTGGWWFVNLIQDMLNTIFIAWAFPLYSLAFSLRLRDFLFGLGLALLAGLLTWLVIKNITESENGESSPRLYRQALWLGLWAVFGGLIPITVANRQVDFANYSRYTLPAMLGAAIIVSALIFSMSNRAWRYIALALLVVTATLTHHANAVNASINQQIVQNFWWQVSWRAPQIKPGTLLTAIHAGFGIQEDYFIWGPANLIYYPQPQTGEQVKITLPAAILTDGNMLKMITGKGYEEFNRRGNLSIREYDNILVLTQPNPSACVRILDGSAPELSTSDDNRIRLVASSSRIENILLDGSHSHPLESVFGPEPPHTWCYSYQKASLARQQGDWETVAKLGDEALEAGHYPGDKVEWLPFLQAYVILDQPEKVRQIARILREEPYLAMQACEMLQAIEAVSNENDQIINNILCR
jgi:hypothetical protein